MICYWILLVTKAKKSDEKYACYAIKWHTIWSILVSCSHVGSAVDIAQHWLILRFELTYLDMNMKQPCKNWNVKHSKFFLLFSDSILPMTLIQQRWWEVAKFRICDHDTSSRQYGENFAIGYSGSVSRGCCNRYGMRSFILQKKSSIDSWNKL